MSVHDLCCIGYITQDKIVTTKNTIYMPGGTSFFTLRMPSSISTRTASYWSHPLPTEMNVVEDIRKEGIEGKKASASARSVCFENIYGKPRTNVRNASRQKADRSQWKACGTSMHGLSTWAACLRRRLFIGRHQIPVGQRPAFGRRSGVPAQGGQ